ncbi:MAG TPA: NfeD family protein [Candidatus Dormibacteraeota bacterium]|nr:NfeD family protein [Candidatus Dormibacteraeota bacterium]
MIIAWIASALVFAVVEIASAAFYAAFLAVGAVGAALAAAFGADVFVQAIVFLVIAVIGIVALRPAMLGRRGPKLVSGAGGMIGQSALVTDSIEGDHERGHVEVAGEQWPAVSADGKPIKAEATVTVVEIRGATLVVKR